MLCLRKLYIPLLLLLLLAFTVLLFTTSSAEAHLVANASKPKTLYWVEKVQERNLAHVKYFCKHAHIWKNRKWHCQARRWIWRELSETRRTMSQIASAVSIAAWLPTYYCERGADGWATDTGNGYYGGLQFDHDTWVRHGGLEYAWNAHLATPLEQVTVASRLTYDGWPRCPNP